MSKKLTKEQVTTLNGNMKGLDSVRKLGTDGLRLTHEGVQVDIVRGDDGRYRPRSTNWAMLRQKGLVKQALFIDGTPESALLATLNANLPHAESIIGEVKEFGADNRTTRTDKNALFKL